MFFRKRKRIVMTEIKYFNSNVTNSILKILNIYYYYIIIINIYFCEHELQILRYYYLIKSLGLYIAR